MGADPEPWVLIPNHLHLVSFVAGGELARIALARVLDNMARANGLDRTASNIARAAQPDADVELATEMVSLATAKRRTMQTWRSLGQHTRRWARWSASSPERP